LEKGKKGGRKKTTEKLKYHQKLTLMEPQTEIQKETQTEKPKDIRCADIERAPFDLTLSGGLFTALYNAARVIGREYDNYVKVCRDRDKGVVAIMGGFSLEPYLKDCVTACLRSQTKTLVKANCYHPDALDMCKEVCGDVLKSHAKLILTTNYRHITYELTWNNVNFEAHLYDDSFTIIAED
jgi:hypothetical protein